MSQQDQLIGDTLAMVNVVRQAFGKEALAELPDANPGNASDCLFYRALSDVGVKNVSGASMDFSSDRIAEVVSSLWGTESHGQTVRAPRQFSEVIGLFDKNHLPHYNALRG